MLYVYKHDIRKILFLFQSKLQITYIGIIYELVCFYVPFII